MIGQIVSGINNFTIWKHRVNVWGFKLTPCNGDRCLNLYLHRFGLMGKSQKLMYEKLLTPGMTVLDVGANQGLYSLLFSRLVGPSGHVHSFEPDAHLFANLEANCSVNAARNITCYNYALGAQTATQTLFHSRVNSGDNRLAASEREEWFYQVAVQVRTADSVLAGKPVDFIKIDVQGWEFEVLKGMTQLWRANSALSVYFEFWPFGLRRAGCEPEELLRFVQEAGFQLQDATPEGLRPVEEAEKFCQQFQGYQATNVLAVRKGNAI